MNKTPVSMLQEMMAKKHTTPNYELIHDGGGSHINTFTWQVTCDGLTATGTGRCKRDAKHEAAKAMLEAIAAHHAYPQLEPSPAQSPIRTPVPPTVPPSPRIPPNIPFVNAIGDLQLLCTEHDMEEAQYVLISDVGPPHAKVFTYHCVVASFRVEGIAATKKQAKHEAARKMYDRIIQILSNSKISYELCGDRNSEENQRKQSLLTETAISRYTQISKVFAAKKSSLGLVLSNAHQMIKKDVDEDIRNEVREKLNSFVPDTNIKIDEKMEQIFSEFESVLEMLKVTSDENAVDSKSDSVCLEQLVINTNPAIVEIGTGSTKSEAKLNALLRMIKTLLLLLK